MPLSYFMNTTIGRSLFAPITRAYQNAICKEVAKYGLRVEDMVRVSEMGQLGKQAIALMPEHAQQARLRRLIRAQDLGNKHIHLTEAQQKMQQPMKKDLIPIIEHLQQRDLERRTYK